MKADKTDTRDTTEKMVCEYFHQSLNYEVDTEKLIQNLKPTIIKKCNFIKSSKSELSENLFFIIGAAAVFIIGLVMLFPEVIDYSDELVQFVTAAIAILGILTIIFATLNNISSKLQNNNFRFRGKLL